MAGPALTWPPLRCGPAGRRTQALLRAVAAACALAGPAAAAPLDVLLSATPRAPGPGQNGRLELGLDGASRALDFSTSADPAEQNPANTEGGYQGAHLQAAWRASDRLWLTGGLWQRRIHNAVDSFRYHSVQVAAQWRLNEPAGPGPVWAVRLGAWGSQASQTAATTPVRVPGAILDTVTISRPGDRQVQADLLATWALSGALDLTAQAGIGLSQLHYGGLRATTTRNACPYQLTFNGNDIFGTLAGPCSGGTGGGVVRQFFDSSGDYGVDVAREIAWRGQFVQAGLAAHWRSGPWALAGGYLLHATRRRDVDDILARRGDPVHRHNHQLTAEAAYAMTPRLSVFGRAQVNSHLFFNDIPVTYNASTSGSFGNRFSMLTLGLRAGF